MRGRAGIVVCLAALGCAVLIAQAATGSASGDRRVVVAQGRFANHYWSLAVEGRRHRRCYELKLRGNNVVIGGLGPCESDRHRPPLWRQVTGTSDDHATVMLMVTRDRVRSMRLRIGHPHTDRSPTWIRVRARRITRHQAHEAGVRRNWRFAVLHSRGTLCVKQGVLFDRKGQRIKKQRVPCEF